MHSIPVIERRVYKMTPFWVRIFFANEQAFMTVRMMFTAVRSCFLRKAAKPQKVEAN